MLEKLHVGRGASLEGGTAWCGEQASRVHLADSEGSRGESSAGTCSGMMVPELTWLVFHIRERQGNFLWTSNISRWRISRLKSCKWAQTTYPLPRVAGQVRCRVQATPRQKEVLEAPPSAPPPSSLGPPHLCSILHLILLCASLPLLRVGRPLLGHHLHSPERWAVGSLGTSGPG